MRQLLFCILSLIMVTAVPTKDPCNPNAAIQDALNCMNYVTSFLEQGDISLLQDLEKTVVTATTSQSLSLSAGRFVAYLHRIPLTFPSPVFSGLTIYANNSQAMTGILPNPVVSVQLPKELPVNRFHKLAFNMVSLPQKATNELVRAPNYLYENRLVGLGVEDTSQMVRTIKTISGLQEFVNISMNVTTSINVTHKPQCVFLNYSANSTLGTDGCVTQWQPGESHIICSCNHLTFFGVLMISNKASAEVPPKDVEILTYITFIGCSISFCALLVAVLLFTMKRNIRSDVSMRMHVNLAIALMFLNMHFLPNSAMGIWQFSWPSPWLCFYMALALHFSLLASFCWMAVEGFHLYLLLVKVFNIYVKKYLLKVSLVGWGIPAVIVSVVVIIDRKVYGVYGPVSFHSNNTEICYINNDLIKYGTTLGLFSLVFLFNLIMLMVTIRNILSMRKSKQFGPNDCNRAKKDICTLLGVITLLGTTWGLIFFSFGQLTTIGLYAFSILNPLQGLFIFVWFVLSAIKIGKATRTSTATKSSHG